MLLFNANIFKRIAPRIGEQAAVVIRSFDYSWIQKTGENHK